METELTAHGLEVPKVAPREKREDGCTCLRSNGGLILSYDPFCLAPLSHRHGRMSTRRKPKEWRRK